MKTLQTLLLISALLWAGPAAMAQEDNILGAITEAAKAIGDSGTEAESEADAAWKEEWQKNWEETKEFYEGSARAFSTPELKCMALMTLYVSEYIELIETTKKITECKKKYDFYGLQLLTLTMGQTMLYCPEDISNFSDTKKKELNKQFWNILESNISSASITTENGYFKDSKLNSSKEEMDAIAEAYDGYFEHLKSGNHNVYDKIYQNAIYIKYYRSYGGNHWAAFKGQYTSVEELLDGEFEDSDYDPQPDTHATRWDEMSKSYPEYLIFPFRPDYFIWRTVEVGEKMEALGCGG